MFSFLSRHPPCRCLDATASSVKRDSPRAPLGGVAFVVTARTWAEAWHNGGRNLRSLLSLLLCRRCRRRAGSQTLEARCVRKSSGETVSDYFCNFSERPTIVSRPCNEHDCPARWVDSCLIDKWCGKTGLVEP